MGYVRFGVALAAALSLHALILLSLNSLYSVQGEVKDSKLIQVSILSQNKPVQAPNLVEQEVSHEQINSDEAYGRDVAKPEPTVEQYEALRPAYAVSEEQSVESPLILVPEHLQTSILAKVSYPRRARRHGWEGDAELHFYVNRHSVQDISLFVSTGFLSLDQAAYQALASISSLPLMDGNYRLPVKFRIE